MPGLSPQSRSIIQAARHGDDPTPEDRARIRRSVALRIGASVAAGGVAATASSSAAASLSAVLGGTLGKVVLAAAVVTLGGTGYYMAMRPPEAAAPRVTAVAPTATVSSAPAPAPGLAAEPATAMAAASAEVGDPGRIHPAGVAPQESAVATSDLDKEVAKLRTAHEALRDGKPDEAMNALEQSRDDVLAEERAAMRVFALCRMGKTEEARVEAARFLSTWPRSPQAGRVRAACAVASPSGS